MRPVESIRARGTDRWIALAAPTEEVWRALCKASGQPWAEDRRFAAASARLANREALDATIGAWTAGFEAGALEELLQGVGVPVHRVSTSADIMADPQLKARAHFIYLDHPRLGTRMPLEASRMCFSRTPAPVTWPGPQIGEHNNYILRELLGMSDAQITKLVIDEALA
jgi:crotonobetainyl-CoA:carnitine CoA-transferase CaiB-like acyl-CoA transferase